MMIKLADDFGPALTGRALAAELRERVERAVGRGECVTLDFDRVEAISPSFADEVFGKISASLVDSGAVRFKNLHEDLAAVARFVAGSRARPPES